MSDFWAFRTMVTPVIIQILFWIGAILCLIIGAIMVIYGATHYQGGQGHYLWKGVLLFVLGPLGVRVYCEILIIFFRINETLTEIKHAMGNARPRRESFCWTRMTGRRQDALGSDVSSPHKLTLFPPHLASPGPFQL